MSPYLDYAIPILTIFGLFTAIYMFFSTYFSARKQSAALMKILSEQEEAQISRVKQIDNALDSVLSVISDGQGEIRAVSKDELRPMLDEVLTSLKLLDRSMVDLKDKNFAVMNNKVIEEAMRRQAQLKRSLNYRSIN